MYIKLTYDYVKQATSEAASTSDEIEYTYTITNNGLLTLYNVSVQDETLGEREIDIMCTDVDLRTTRGTSHGVFTGLASYPHNGLVPGASIACTADDGVSQAEVRTNGGFDLLLTFLAIDFASWFFSLPSPSRVWQLVCSLCGR